MSSNKTTTIGGSLLHMALEGSQFPPRDTAEASLVAYALDVAMIAPANADETPATTAPQGLLDELAELDELIARAKQIDEQFAEPSRVRVTLERTRDDVKKKIALYEAGKRAGRGER